MVVRGTKQFLDRAGRPDRSEMQSSSVLGDWYANVWFWRPQVAVFVSERTLLPEGAVSALAARLTEASSTVAGALTADEVAVIRRYQGLDRAYELVASVMRGLRSSADLTAPEAELVTTILRVLPVSIARWRVPEPLRVYRGQRSVAGFLGSGAREEKGSRSRLVSVDDDLPGGGAR